MPCRNVRQAASGFKINPDSPATQLKENRLNFLFRCAVLISSRINNKLTTITILRCNMSEGGASGDAVRVTHNGAYSLPGWAGSALVNLEVTEHS